MNECLTFGYMCQQREGKHIPLRIRKSKEEKQDERKKEGECTGETCYYIHCLNQDNKSMEGNWQ